MVERFKSAVHGKHGLRSATVLLVITLFFSNVLGLLRNILLASQAHALAQLDPYYAAFRLPDLIFNILILGAISSAFIPVYTETLKDQGKPGADRLANTLLGNLLVLVLLGIIIIWLVAPAAVPILVHNFSVEQQRQTVHLTRIMLLSPLFFTLSYIAGAVLNAHKRFFSYSIAPLIYNLAIIGGAILLPRFGAEGVAWSVVIGALLHFLTQVPTLLTMKFRIRPRVHLRDALVGRIIRLTVPRTFSLVMTQVALLVFTVLASSLHPGALTIFSLSNDLQTTPAIIFGASLATAVFPTLSEAVANHDNQTFQYYLHRTLRVSLFTVIPLTVLVFVLRAQITRLYIGLGHNISWDDTIRTIHTIAWFTISFTAQAFVFILARGFYAMQDTRRPMIASIIATTLTIVLAITLPMSAYFSLVNHNDVASLATAYSAGMWLQAMLLLLWLPPAWKGNLQEVWKSGLTSALSALVAGFMTWMTLRLVGEGLHINQLPITFTGIGTNTIIRLAIQGAVSASVGVMVYLILAYVMQMDELRWLKNFKGEKTDGHQTS